jgi:ParB family chromosome partitioning protein
MYKQATPVKKTQKTALAPTFKKIEDNLASHFNTRVKMQHHKNGHGMINLEYYSIEELNAILEKMNITVH